MRALAMRIVGALLACCVGLGMGVLRTPLDVAKGYNQPELVDKLKSIGAR